MFGLLAEGATGPLRAGGSIVGLANTFVKSPGSAGPVGRTGGGAAGAPGPGRPAAGGTPVPSDP